MSVGRTKVDAHADRRVAVLAADQFGVLSRDELHRCGLTAKAINIRVANGRLHRLHRGVYAVGHPNPPLHGGFLAAVKACGCGARLSHYAAAALWEFVEWDGRFPEVTVLGTTARLHPGIRVHRVRALDPADVTRHCGVAITSPARTLLDLASTLPQRPLRRAVRQAQALHRVNDRQLVQLLARVGRRQGVAKLALIVAEGPTPTRTELEDVVLDVMLAGGLVRPCVNEPLVLAGRRVIPDFRWPAQRLVVEADGAAWHDNRLAREDDAERQAILEAHGERVLRVTWDQAVLRPAETVTRLRAAGAPTRQQASKSWPATRPILSQRTTGDRW